MEYLYYKNFISMLDNLEGIKMHKHIGFFIDNNTALSNDYKLGYPKLHEIDFNKRKIIQCIKYIKNDFI